MLQGGNQDKLGDKLISISYIYFSLWLAHDCDYFDGYILA